MDPALASLGPLPHPFARGTRPARLGATIHWSPQSRTDLVLSRTSIRWSLPLGRPSALPGQRPGSVRARVLRDRPAPSGDRTRSVRTRALVRVFGEGRIQAPRQGQSALAPISRRRDVRKVALRMGLISSAAPPLAAGHSVMFQVPVWYAVLGRFARATLRVAHSERTGPWPPYQTDLVLSGAEASVWIHAASLGETKGVLALLRHLPSHVGVTLTATTTAGRERLRKSGHEAFLLPCDDHRTVSDFLATRHIQKALFLEAEAWPAILGTLQKAKIQIGRASCRARV